jgi:hypothetical protein
MADKGEYLTDEQKAGLERARGIQTQKVIVAKHLQMKKLAEKVIAQHVKMAKLAKLVTIKHVQMAKLAKRLEELQAAGALPKG